MRRSTLVSLTFLPWIYSPPDYRQWLTDEETRCAEKISNGVTMNIRRAGMG
jgi:hypothetical protein